MALTIGNIDLKYPSVMAPMCGISDSPWRRLVRKFHAGLVFTEMTSSEALTRKKDRSFQLLSHQPDEGPVVMQLCGSEPQVLAEAAKICESLGAAMVDLNMGCPVRKITSQGAGSALLLDMPRVAAILRAMVSAVKIPVTLKVRSGWDGRQNTCFEVARIAEAEGIAAIYIHARTKSQEFSGHADWRVIQSLVESTRLPIIGNGDVTSAKDGARMLDETKCHAVMIGRGAQGRPWVFQEFADPAFQVSHQQRYEAIRQHYLDSLSFYGGVEGLLMMRKHLGWYSKSIPGGADFREQIMKLREPTPVLKAIDEFFGHPAAEA